MRWSKAIASLLLVGLLFTPAFVRAVASRCAGEASFAVHACACTVRNRIEAGWSTRTVLSAYYAADRRPTGQQIQEAQRGLEGDGCDPGWYFLLSPSDSRRLGMRPADRSGSVGQGEQAVYMYPLAAWRNR